MECVNHDSLYKTIADIVRIEVDQENNDVFLVFKVSDPGFKKRVIQDWTQDINLEIKYKQLVLKKDE